MKKCRILSIIIVMALTLFITGCSFKKKKVPISITIIEPSGEQSEYSAFEGERFKYAIPENDSIFLGCYSRGFAAYNDFAFIDCNGDSVVWDKGYPTVLYSSYMETPINYSKTEEKVLSLKIGEITQSFSLESGLTKYLENHFDTNYIVELGFSHYEKKTDVSGVGASNWINADLYIGKKDNVKYSYSDTKTTQLESSYSYRDEKQIFKNVKGSEFAGGEIGIKFIRPTTNASSQPGLFKNFTLKIYEQNEENGKYSNTYIEQRGDIALQPSSVIYSKATKFIDITDEYIEACKYYNPDKVKIKISCFNSGTRVIARNWANLEIRIKNINENNIYEEKGIMLENNSGSALYYNTIEMTKDEFLNAKTIELYYWYDTVKNISGLWYYVSDIKVEFDFS